MSVKAMDVANFFIDYFKDSEDPMTKVRLQKFIYYAQIETMVRTGHCLFKDDFEAWHFGPVVPRVSAVFQNKADGEPITKIVGEYDIHLFTPEELEILVDVAKYCGKYSTAELSRKTHIQGGPWQQFHTETGKATVIPKKTIKAFYKSNDPIPHSTADSIRALQKEGRTENGKLIIPADWE
jgi:uncharacterized phage-associated protein